MPDAEALSDAHPGLHLPVSTDEVTFTCDAASVCESRPAVSGQSRLVRPAKLDSKHILLLLKVTVALNWQNELGMKVPK